MKTKQTERKLSNGIGLTRHFISGVLCLAVISLLCARASAQNLFAVGVSDGSIDEFTPNGVRSTFPSGLNYPVGLAFDNAGNLFVACANAGNGAVYKFTSAACPTTFASGLNYPSGLAFDNAGNLFVADAGSNAVYKFTPAGVRSTFVSGLNYPSGLAFDNAGNLFVADGGNILKFTPDRVRSTFARGLLDAVALAFDSAGNLFVADRGFDDDTVFGAAVYKFTPSGVRSTVVSESNQHYPVPDGLAIDSADNLFVSDGFGNILKFTPNGVHTTFASGASRPLAFSPTTLVPVGESSKRQYAPNGDLVSEQQCLCWFGVWPNSCGRLESQKCGGFQSRQPSRLRLVQFRYGANGDLVFVRANADWERVRADSSRRLGVGVYSRF